MSNDQQLEDDQFHESLSINLAPFVQELSEKYVEVCNRATYTIKQIYKSKHDELHYNITRLRQEISRLTIKLHQQEESYCILLSKSDIRNTQLSVWLKNISSRRFQKTLLLHWKQYVTRQRMNEKIIESSLKRIHTKLKFRYLATWRDHYHSAVMKREEEKNEKKLLIISKEIIIQYDNEIDKLRRELKVAYERIEHGEFLRQNLEDKIRRTILQGMTAMNMESMDIFNSYTKEDRK